jgi:probable selenium-dependent hydroxylase accessory protein YqeC
MTASLLDRLGLGGRELVSIVGAGGKTTIMGMLANDLGSLGASVIMTTTTKMGADQVTEPVCWSADPGVVDQALIPGRPLLVLAGAANGKVTGLRPDAVDALFHATTADDVIVEADGARSLSIKAPADHEPAIPRLSTTVIVVAGADALMNALGTVAHRVDRISALTGLTDTDRLTPEHAATILLHPDGGLKAIPENARVVMVITKVAPDNVVPARSLAAMLEAHPRVDRCLTLNLS